MSEMKPYQEKLMKMLQKRDKFIILRPRCPGKFQPVKNIKNLEKLQGTNPVSIIFDEFAGWDKK